MTQQEILVWVNQYVSQESQKAEMVRILTYYGSPSDRDCAKMRLKVEDLYDAGDEAAKTAYIKSVIDTCKANEDFTAYYVSEGYREDMNKLMFSYFVDYNSIELVDFKEVIKNLFDAQEEEKLEVYCEEMVLIERIKQSIDTTADEIAKAKEETESIVTIEEMRIIFWGLCNTFTSTLGSSTHTVGDYVTLKAQCEDMLSKTRETYDAIIKGGITPEVIQQLKELIASGGVKNIQSGLDSAPGTILVTKDTIQNIKVSGIGDYDDLTTTSKTLIGAINEVNAKSGNVSTAKVVKYWVTDGVKPTGAEGEYCYDALNKKLWKKGVSNWLEEAMAVDTIYIYDKQLWIYDETELVKDNAKVEILDGSLTKAKMDAGVQASLDKADTALQTHQDISGKQDVIADLNTIRAHSEEGSLANTVIVDNSLNNIHYISEGVIRVGGHDYTISKINDIDNKVDKETGKGLFSGSYNDLTDKPTVDTALNATSTNAVENKAIQTAIGDLTTLTTTAKGNIVAAINELAAKINIVVGGTTPDIP